MWSDNTKPEQLAFWKNRLVDGSIVSALRMYPEHAKTIFGAVPVMGEDVLLLGLILAARAVLAESPGAVTFDKIAELDKIEEELRVLLHKFPDDERSKCLDMLSPQKREGLLRELAGSIIRQATGMEPR
jgi:hypothetical protein